MTTTGIDGTNYAPNDGKRPDYDYKQGLVPLIEKGVIEACGPFVIVRAILEADAYGSLSHGVEYDMKGAICHEVIAIGPEVTRAHAGQHVFIRSSAADRMTISDKTCRYWTVHQDDIMARWDPQPL